MPRRPGNGSPSGKSLPGSFIIRPLSSGPRSRWSRPSATGLGSWPNWGFNRGGVKREEGDVCICFQAFPKIPVCLILWAGDDEFPPDGNVLFDASIARYLMAEDVAVLAGMVVYPLIGMAYKKG